jgi:hypothetical protein
VSRCKDCNICMWEGRIKFYNKYCCFLCDDCLKKRKLKARSKDGKE